MTDHLNEKILEAWDLELSDSHTWEHLSDWIMNEATPKVLGEIVANELEDEPDAINDIRITLHDVLYDKWIIFEREQHHK